MNEPVLYFYPQHHYIQLTSIHHVLLFCIQSECREEDGGLNCFSETVPDGYGKFVTTPLQVEGDMNDVRACNSEPFEYYYQIGARWVPKVAADGTVSTLKPINFYNYIGGGNVNPNDQSTLILTFQVPTASDSLYW